MGVAKEKPRLFKDFYNRESVGRLADAVKEVYSAFRTDSFLSAVFTSEFRGAELKERTRLIARALKDFLPEDYGRAVAILIRVAPKVGEFENWTLTTFVQLYGLEHFRESVNAMHALTRHGTAEFAIRPYINQYQNEMLNVLSEWVHDSNEHVRRLAAEGTRPRGVWCEHIPAFRKDPSPVVALLEYLKADPSLYVRKAVANNLNDISRDNPSIALKVATRWIKDKNPLTNWIVKRACRSLIKSGQPEVFAILGYTSNPKVFISRLKIAKSRLRIGGTTTITGELVSKASSKQKVVIDYRVSYVTKLGKTTRKVFKYTDKSLEAGETIPLVINHSFKNHTTRTHYPGKHIIEIVVNGIVHGSVAVHLTK